MLLFLAKEKQVTKKALNKSIIAATQSCKGQIFQRQGEASMFFAMRREHCGGKTCGQSDRHSEDELQNASSSNLFKLHFSTTQGYTKPPQLKQHYTSQYLPAVSSDVDYTTEFSSSPCLYNEAARPARRRRQHLDVCKWHSIS